jgi:hypothetical protein
MSFCSLVALSIVMKVMVSLSRFIDSAIAGILFAPTEVGGILNCDDLVKNILMAIIFLDELT